MHTLDNRFPRYREFSPEVPVWCLTPEHQGCFHRFFDTSPISPSGRFVAVTSLRAEQRLPAPDDVADVVVVDLQAGTAEVVATTECFDTQLGAQAQWGPDDTLYFNDLSWEDGKPRPRAVKTAPDGSDRTELDGPVYMVSPDGARLASPCLLRTALTQPGYGAVVLPTQIPYNRGASSHDGIYLTSCERGMSELFVSMADIVNQRGDEISASFKRAGAELSDRDLYGFHVKWNPQGTRLLFVVRARSGDPSERLLNMVVTVDVDTRAVHMAMPPDLWQRGGHHPQWHPDGEQVIMNLNFPEDEMRFVSYPYDGGEPSVLAEGVFGGGHPTLHPDGRYILTDEYEHGPLAYPDGTTPIRFVDTDTGAVREVVRIRTRPDYHARGRELRVDPHPAWDPTFRYAVFNGCPNGGRQVFLADLTGLMT